MDKCTLVASLLLALAVVVNAGGSAEYGYDVAIHHPDHYTLGHAKSQHYEARVIPHLARLHTAEVVHKAPVAVAERLAVAAVPGVTHHGVRHLGVHEPAHFGGHGLALAHHAAVLPALHHGGLGHHGLGGLHHGLQGHVH